MRAAILSSVVMASWFAAFAGCTAARDAAPVDAEAAAPDASSCPANAMFTPVTVTGTSPSGSLDVFHYAYAGYATGFCAEQYLIHVAAAQADPSCADAPGLLLAIFAPFTTTGTNRASASLPDVNERTERVTFEATKLDLPDATPPHIAGRFVSQDPAWSFDIAIDLTSQSSTTCL
jgi:hypothetical protein